METTITIRNIDDAVVRAIETRAEQNGRSLEAEVREILKDASGKPPHTPQERSGANLAEAIRKRFAAIGGVDLEIPPRGPARKPVEFD